MTRSCWLFIAALISAAPAVGQPAGLGGAIAAGEVGERYDGYMGIVGNPAPAVQRQVSAINIRRRNLYLELASRRNVTAELVGIATACQLFTQLAAGEAYMLNDRIWRRRGPGQAAPVPNECR